MSSPTQKQKLRNAITSYCRAAVGNEPHIHYSQQRPFHFYNDLGHGHATLDCSGFVGNVFHYAMRTCGIFLHDPLDENWTGWGNTWTLEAWLRKHGKAVSEVNGYLVGDIARFGEGRHSHVIVCSKAGTAKTSMWTSHGQEAGPKAVALGYRNDLIGVWRHPSLL